MSEIIFDTNFRENSVTPKTMLTKQITISGIKIGNKPLIYTYIDISRKFNSGFQLTSSPATHTLTLSLRFRTNIQLHLLNYLINFQLTFHKLYIFHNLYINTLHIIP